MEIGDRMKRYEDAFRYSLPARQPVIIRVDGKAFHSFTKNCKKPFDDTIEYCMDYTAAKLLEQIQNAKLAYVQSDEISILLVDYSKFDTEQWFKGNIQKMASVSASVAGVSFSSAWRKQTGEYKAAYFDSRVFVLPERDVGNYFLWRQQDATRNSIQMVAQANYSHKELQGLSCAKLKEKLKADSRNIDWDDLKAYRKYGRCLYRNTNPPAIANEYYRGARFSIEPAPLFRKNVEFIYDFLKVEEE